MCNVHYRLYWNYSLEICLMLTWWYRASQNEYRNLNGCIFIHCTSSLPWISGNRTRAEKSRVFGVETKIWRSSCMHSDKQYGKSSHLENLQKITFQQKMGKLIFMLNIFRWSSIAGCFAPCSFIYTHLSHSFNACKYSQWLRFDVRVCECVHLKNTMPLYAFVHSVQQCEN